MIKVAPKSDLLVLLTCFGLTVVFDMVIAVSVGIVLAAILFMHRMAEIASFRLSSDSASHLTDRPLPKGVVVYEIAGALFFGATQKAISALEEVSGANTVIIVMAAVPAMDVT